MLPPTYGRNNLFNGRFSTPVQREWRIAMYTMGPLNISNFFQCRLTLPNSMDDQLPEGMFTKARCLTRPARARQDVPFLGQGRRALGRGGYRRVREHDKRPTCLHARGEALQRVNAKPLQRRQGTPRADPTPSRGYAFLTFP